jgi:hypothetical protein
MDAQITLVMEAVTRVLHGSLSLVAEFDPVVEPISSHLSSL